MHTHPKQFGAWLSRDGVTFRVWAPFAERVSVIGSFNEWTEQALQSEGDGNWSTFVKDAVAGQEYKFVIHNGEQTLYRNDPRSRHITTSSGNSVIAEHTFDWGDDDFTPPPVEQQVIYELHIGTFFRPDPASGGTFRDVAEKLDYLVELGVNMIELMPINSMLDDRGWGYAADYIYTIESLYGSRHDFLEFVKAAHQRGMGVILDVVYNHFGPDDNLDLWQFDGWHENNQGGIYFYNDWRAETPWGNTRPDYGRPEVRQYITDNVKMWLQECRLDGLRVDSTIFIRNAKGNNNDPSNDLPEGWHILQDINNLAKKIKPEAIMIGEDVGDNEYIVKPTKDGGAGFNAQWETGFPYSLRNALKNQDLTALCGELVKYYNGSAWQRVVYSDSHDSAANGSARLAEELAPGKSGNRFSRQQSLLAAALVLTTPGIPMLFQGQEFMQGGAFNDWQALDWSNTEKYKGIITAYQHLIAHRKNAHGVTAGLQGNSMNLMHVDENNKVIAYHRWQSGGAKDDVVVILNFADRQHDQYVLGLPREGQWQVRFNSSWQGYSPDFPDVLVPEVTTEQGEASLILPPNSVLILSQDS